MHSADPFEVLIKSCSLNEIRAAVRKCMECTDTENVPRLYDGGGIPYTHKKACYFIFSWMARDAATQRLKPMIMRAHHKTNENILDIEIETLSNLLFSYREKLMYFN